MRSGKIDEWRIKETRGKNIHSKFEKKIGPLATRVNMDLEEMKGLIRIIKDRSEAANSLRGTGQKMQTK